MFNYECDLAGIKVKNSKVHMRELTEEEKAEQEAKTTKGGGKAAPAKGKGAVKEEEPSAEELARIANEKEAMEESKRQLQLEWDALDDDEKHYRTSEDIQKEPCIQFSNAVMQHRIDQLKEKLSGAVVGEEISEENKIYQEEIDTLQAEVNTGLSICEKTSFELVEFEEAVRDEGGAWLKFMKLPTPENTIDPAAADAKGKAPPKKGKGPAVDDLKPIFSRAWVSFKAL